MKRTLVLLTAVGLLFAPAALAKGPHAVLSPGQDPVEAGEPWELTLELMEMPGKAHRAQPALMARHGDRLVTVRGRLAGGDEFMSRYEVVVELPEEGRWRIEVVDRKRRFLFPDVLVGSGQVPQGWVAFPEGSLADREGGGGPYDAPETSVGHGEPLPPETVRLASTDASRSADGGGIGLWILPVAGLALAGAGAGLRRLRRR